MGGSSDQVTGYKYVTNFLLFIGNPIEKVLGINFDKRGWLTPLIDEMKNPLSVGTVEKPTLYGENEGGVAGQIYAKYGSDNQEIVPFYKDYMDLKELPASAYPFQSYLAFKDFYVGNSGYMKEMLLWPKRTRIRNDGRRQWYEMREDSAVVCEIDSYSYYGEYISPHVGYLEFIENGNNARVGWQGSQATQGNSGSSGLAELSFEYSSATDISVEIYSFLWFVPNTTVELSSNAISESLKKQETEPWAESLTGTMVFEKGANKTAKIFVNYSTPTSGRFDWFIAKPTASGGRVLGEVTGVDINPIHKIREILTDDTAMNKPEISVNDENFIKAADWIYEEGLGVSWSITEKSCIDAINELCYHIEAGIRVNRQTGLYEMVLFRDNWFEEDEIHSIPESKIKSMQYEITNADEVINQVNVNFYDRENIKNSSFSISESGLIQTLGRVNAETLDFPYFMNMRNAEIVANWKLKQLSTGAFKGTFTTGWREARKWNRYDLIRLPWSKRWTGTILVRIMSINLGGPTNNEVTIEYIEVVPATGMMNTTIVIDDPIDTKPEAPKPCNAKVFELPYFEAVQAFGEREVITELTDNPEAGYLCAIAEKPQNNSLNAALYVNSGNDFERVATINYCETAYLDQAIDRMSSSFIVKNVGNIASVRAGSKIFINDEIMVYQSYDAETKVLTAKRGAFGVPQNHPVNSILYFADDFVAVDQTLYVEDEIIEAKALTTTPSGVLSLTDAVTHEVEMQARAIRPYPPANVKFNGAYFPETQIVTNDIVLTWAHRNRVQQTGGEIIGWYEGDLAVEDGVTYSYELTSNNTLLASASNITLNTVTINASVLIPNKAHTLKLWSMRDGYQSYQIFEHSFFAEAVSLILSATVESNRVFGSTLSAANISVNVDDSLRANMQADGLAISGKSEVGATITIEIEE